MNELFWRTELLCWDNEGAGDGADTSEADAAAAAAAAEAAQKAATETVEATKEKTFNQEEVNKFVAERNKALKAKFEQMEKSYEGLLQQQHLTNEQRGNLENELDAVRREMMTKEQRLEDEKKKAAAKHEQ